MRPTVRSRLVASAVAFLVGFGVANVGILVVVGRDRWVWLAVAVVLMLTGAVGVLVADTGRSLSIWAVLGLEALVLFTVLPLLWTFTLATTPSDTTATSLWPADVDWSAFGDAAGSALLQRATVTSLLVAVVATVVSMLLAVPAAHALVNGTWRGRRLVYALFAAALLAPLLAFVAPTADLLLSLGLFDRRVGLLLPMLLVTLPLALWLSVSVLRRAPWSLRDSVRADGATRWQEVRAFGWPALGPGLLLVTAVVLVLASHDAVVGSALSASERSRPLPATLLLASGELENPSAMVAATGLLWLLPVLVLVAAVPRRLSALIGRPPR